MRREPLSGARARRRLCIQAVREERFSRAAVVDLGARGAPRSVWTARARRRGAQALSWKRAFVVEEGGKRTDVMYGYDVASSA